jgi:catechol 2,3-dioxygenase-like lactoylglutathione lyase family enzyme
MKGPMMKPNYCFSGVTGRAFNLLPWGRIPLTMCLALVGLAWSGGAMRAAEAASEFSKPVIDLGMVVKDASRTAHFLTNAIGFKEVRGFEVTSELGRKIGLLDGQTTTVRVFLLEEGNTATRLKVLAFPQAPGKSADQTFIHTTLGFRYLTLYVKDMNRALERLQAAKVPLLGETPVDLGGGAWLVACKDPDGNFIELIGPRKK